ncbi:MAG: tail fiber domain-containing protein [Prolixibacteraceae bacterium]|nr:tail fiber domain-containing protein [Prolixibacteraceae bacterium]
MKKLVLLLLQIILLFLVLIPSQLKAQEVEVTDDVVRLKNGNGFLSLLGGGDLLYQQNSTSNWIGGIVSKVSNDTQRGLTVVDNSWNSVFKVFGDGTVTVNGVAVHSDSTLKEDIITMDNQIDKLKKINGVTYHLKRDKANDSKKKKTHYGFLAQDVEKIYPDMVFTNDSGVKSIFYTELIPVLLEAVKTQQAEIESQNKQLIEIEKRLAKLELMKSK